MKIVIFAIFYIFLNFDDAIDYLAGADWKCALWLDMCPLDPRDTSTYTGCHVMTTRTNFNRSRNFFFFPFFAFFFRIEKRRPRLQIFSKGGHPISKGGHSKFQALFFALTAQNF